MSIKSDHDAALKELDRRTSEVLVILEGLALDKTLDRDAIIGAMRMVMSAKATVSDAVNLAAMGGA